jgi:hypothetical protein
MADSPGKATGGWRANFRFAADVIQTLAIPILTLGATIVGVHLSNSMKEREIAIAEQNNQQSLRNQRESSETSLRSAMFSELVGPLLQKDNESGKDQSGDMPKAQRLALLAELLTLNFHEHFELGPLLRYVDTLPGQTEDARARLRGTARRVVSRQLAPMLAVGNGTRTEHPGFFEISLNSDVSEPASTSQSCALPKGDSQQTAASLALECSSKANGSPLPVTSPDGKDRLAVSLRAARWDDQTVGIYVLRLDAKGVPDPDAPPIEFTLTPYSFPFSDNTLLPSGNRFGVYLTRVDNIPDVARVMRLSFVWFPKDFVPPRERPLDLDLTVPIASTP